MLAKGIIKLSSSKQSSTLVLAKEKDGTVRFCIDYQKVNGVTLKDPYPLLRIKYCLDALCGIWWFCTFLYIASGYWQVEMAEKDKEKTAFSMVAGLYQFNVMPFGLCNALAKFEWLVIVHTKPFEDSLLNS